MGTLRLFLIRAALVIPAALGVMTLTFFVSHVVAPDPVSLYLPPNANEEMRQQVRSDLGLDQPLGVQYGEFLFGALRGDFGESHVTGNPVTSDLLNRLPATVELAFWSMLLGIPLGIGLGILAAAKRDSPTDFVARGITLLGMAVPMFWLGLIVLYTFSLKLGWFPGPVGRLPFGETPPSGPTGLYLIDSLLSGDLSMAREVIYHLALPVMTLGIIVMAPVARTARTAAVEVLESDYIRTARAMGLSRTTIYLRYVAKNTLLPVVTMVGTLVGAVLSGVVLIEVVFNWPGIGLYALRAIQRSDFSALQGFVVWAALVFIFAFFVVDLMYLVVDPRTRSH